jgi:hypothetical protein
VGDLQKKWSIHICEILERHDLKSDWSEVNLRSRSSYFDLYICAEFLQHNLLARIFDQNSSWVGLNIRKNGVACQALCVKRREGTSWPLELQ